MFESFKRSTLVAVLLMLPLTVHAISFERGYVEGVKHQQQITLQIDLEEFSAFVSESGANLFNDDIVIVAGDGGVIGTSLDNSKLAMAGPSPQHQPTPDGECMATCYQREEVGWRGSL